MLLNDIGSENDGDGSIIPAIPGSSEYNRDGFISYGKFLSWYWDHFDGSITRDLGMWMISSSCSTCDFWDRSQFGFQ